MRGLEPLTYCMPCNRSSQMSYTPIYKKEYTKKRRVLSSTRIALIALSQKPRQTRSPRGDEKFDFPVTLLLSKGFTP